jgi:hypothetical protein
MRFEDERWRLLRDESPLRSERLSASTFLYRILIPLPLLLIPRLRPLVRLYAVATSVLPFTQLFNRLIDTREALWVDKIRTWAGAVPGAHPIAQAEAGRRGDFAGVVESVRIDPIRGTIQAVVTDGTGRMTVEWPITRPTSAHRGLPGHAYFLTGLAVATPDGGLMLQDAFWREIPGPEKA